jgi:mycofactocin precursor
VALGVFNVGTRCLALPADEETVMTEQAVMEATAAETEQDGPDPATDDEALIAGELLVEEVSIDGMCGVY